MIEVGIKLLFVVVSEVSEDLPVLFLVGFPIIDGVETSESLWSGCEYLLSKGSSLLLKWPCCLISEVKADLNWVLLHEKITIVNIREGFL